MAASAATCRTVSRKARPVRIAWQTLGTTYQIVVVEPKPERMAGHPPYYSEAFPEVREGTGMLYFPVTTAREAFPAELGHVARALLAAGFRPVPGIARVDVRMCPIRNMPRLRLPRLEALRAGANPDVKNVVGV